MKNSGSSKAWREPVLLALAGLREPGLGGALAGPEKLLSLLVCARLVPSFSVVGTGDE